MFTKHWNTLIVACILLATSLQAQDYEALIKQIFNTQNSSPNPTTGVQPTPPTILQPNPPIVLQPTTSPTVVQPSPVTVPVPNRGGGSSGNTESGAYKACGIERECVPRYLCKNGKLNDDGLAIIDIRIDGEVCEYLEECCYIGDQTSEPLPLPQPKDPHTGCGYANHQGVGYRITGDSNGESEFGEFPWMVAILREEQAAGEVLSLYECGGALIAPNVVVTAAHCVANQKPDSLIIRAGEWDTQTNQEVLPHADKLVKEIIVHENYNKGTLYNDIALLILDSNFNWVENIQPVCLPPPNTNFDMSRCFATGWGKDKFGRDGIYQVILKKIELPVVPHATCQANLRTTRLGRYYKLNDSFLCAGGERGLDTCKGDGGSPLVCPIPGQRNRYYHAGIVAWGIGCGEEGIPGVYANVAYMRNWMNEKLSSRGIDFTHFTA